MENIITWDVKYSVGIERIDLEHKIFLDLIKNFQKEVFENVSDERLFRLILEIEKYAEFHFISEENFMKLINYPKLEQHINLHFDLLEKLNVAKHSNVNKNDFLNFTVAWFVNHTIQEDKQIYNYCKENNIEINFKLDIVNG